MRVRDTPALALLVIVTACDPGPVEWRESREVGAPVDGFARFSLVDRDLSRFAPLDAPNVPPPEGACLGSVAYARMLGPEWHRAWWEPRDSGRAALITSRSVDGGATWGPPVVVDASDRSTLGCERFPPSIAADSLTRFVHAVFYMRAPNGAGIWYAHSMDSGATWHSQYGLIYGDDPARSSIAADGELAVAGYELPNAAEKRIGLAVSRDGGHTFLPRLIVSSRNGAASSPAVAARRPMLGVAWRERQGRWISRVGLLRRE
jgi:hypothetical protein